MIGQRWSAENGDNGRGSTLRTAALAALAFGVLASPGTAQEENYEEIGSQRPSSYRDIEVSVEGRDERGLDVSRVQFITNWSWDVGRKNSLTLRAPYQSISTSQAGAQDADLDGVKDFQLTYTFAPKDNEETGLNSKWELWMNLPTGSEGLDAEENLALTRLRVSADSFLNPQPSRGFGAGIGYLWTVTKGRRSTDFFARARFMGSYDVLDQPGNQQSSSGIDTYHLGFSQTVDKEKITHNYGAQVIVFGDSDTTTNGVVANQESDNNYLFHYEMTKEINENISAKLRLFYQVRDSLDTLQPGLLFANTLDLGDRFIYNLTFNKKSSEYASWLFGVNGFSTDAAETAAGKVNGTEFDEFYGRLGYVRTSENGQGWSVIADLGLNDDARDYSVAAKWFRNF